MSYVTKRISKSKTQRKSQGVKNKTRLAKTKPNEFCCIIKLDTPRSKEYTKIRRVKDMSEA